jgi:monoamine oxidase
MATPNFDVIVIGAGAAGLSCMRELIRAGVRALCVEAHGRIGGRIHTLHDAPIPIELGAEFVHGRPREIFDLAAAARLEIVGHGGRMVQVIGGHVVEDEEGGPVMEDVKRLGSPEHDRTLRQFLAESNYSDEEKREAIAFAEGFNAARADELSVASLAKDMRAADEIDGNRAFHIREGYDALAGALLAGEVRMDSVVDRVVWRPGDCRVMLTTGEEFGAGQVVVTVPLGVLEAGAIYFDPEPTEILAAVRALRFGQAYRVTFLFERAFWEDDPAFANLGFLISDEPVFPVWWSRLPSREPVLTGWSAGPKADSLLKLTDREVVERALHALEGILGRTPPPVLHAWFHDWAQDPFARGAYSWVPAGALPVRETLARPVADTLYFAGEHTDLLGYGGTVHGAIASGIRAAEQVIGYLRNGRR